jgi:hypothetical protein
VENLFVVSGGFEFVVTFIVYTAWLLAGGPGDRGSIPSRSERFFPLASVSRPALRPSQPTVQWVPGVLPPGLNGGQVVMLTTHPYLVPRSGMSRSCNSSPPKRLRGAYSLIFQYSLLHLCCFFENIPKSDLENYTERHLVCLREMQYETTRGGKKALPVFSQKL